jgi:LysR family transcriptional regulator, transcriptional activator of the cysJI operon
MQGTGYAAVLLYFKCPVTPQVRCPVNAYYSLGYKDMNLNQLKIFYLAAKHGNLSVAAGELNVTQPAVTKGIQRLQAYYDTKFVNRFGKKLILTDAGEILYELAEKIFELERHAEESIREYQQHKKGHIRIHASESFGAYYLPSIMTPFSKLKPHIRISVTILPTEMVVENAASLNSDIGFISYPVENDKLKSREILEDRLVLIVPPGHALADKQHVNPMDLEFQSMIVHEKSSAPRQAIERFISKNRISVSISLELSSNRAIKKAVEDGLGMALISRKVANEEIEAGTLVAVDLPEQTLTRKFYLIHHRDKYISETLQSLIDTVDHWASDYMKRIL